ncbi:MAG: DUF3048 domain-containing protein [Candidatus Promineifilaceae bacterium]
MLSLKSRAVQVVVFCFLLMVVACNVPLADKPVENEATPTALVVVEESTAVEEPVVENIVVDPTLEPTLQPVVVSTLPPPVVVDEAAAAGEAPVADEQAEGDAEEVVEAVEAVVEEPVVDDTIMLSSAEDFIPQGRNPLTGEVVADPAVLNRRPILCKISNWPPQYVRPQSGLNSADIVFEHYAEGVITRFSALFYGETPEQVGPIRSARLVDLELPLMYDAALCFSGGSSGQGANRGVYQLVFDKQFAGRVLRTSDASYFRTGDTSKPFEHTFYNRAAVAWESLETMGQNQAPNYVSNMVFDSEIPYEISAPASYISILHGAGKGTHVEWDWDAARGKWLRSADGTPVIDANDGEQVAVSNVIVLKSPHVINRNICETQTETQCIAFSTEIQIWGSGFATIFRDGRQMNGSWRREDRNANGMMFTFYDDAGNPIPLQLGNSWIQLAPYEYIETTVEVRE